jgi:GNAT superfamily N-acetyltransferase
MRVTIDLRPAPLASPEARALIAALDAELRAQYPEPGANHFRLDEAEVSPGRGVFLIAHLDGEKIGCGAVRMLDAVTAELKRMYVAPPARGRGAGRRILEALEAEARALGATRLVLETGVRQREALSLYERAGFTRIPPFGEYLGSPLSVCMMKDYASP